MTPRERNAQIAMHLNGRHARNVLPVPFDAEPATHHICTAEACTDADDIAPAWGHASDDAWATTVPDAFDCTPIVRPFSLATPNPRSPADWRAIGWPDTAANELASLAATLEVAEPAPPIEPLATRLPPPVAGTAQVARYHWGRTMHETCTMATDADVIALRGNLARQEAERAEVARRLAGTTATVAEAAERDRRVQQVLRSGLGRTSGAATLPQLTAAERAHLFADMKWASIAVGTMVGMGFLAGIAAGNDWWGIFGAWQ